MPSDSQLAARLTEAVQHHRAGRLTEAETIYRAVLDIAPTQPDALHLLGMAAHQKGQNDLAADLIARSIAVRPDAADSHGHLGLVLRRLGRLDEAVAACRKALALDSTLVEVHNTLGNALMDLGRTEDAVASYRAAIASQPDYAEAHYNHGNALQKLGRWADAADSLRTAITRKPAFPEAHNNLGLVLHDLGRLEDALACYRQAISLRPNFPEAHNNLGRALKDLGRLDDAVASYRQALALKPDYPEAHGNLGTALASLGAFDDARAHHEQASRLAPEDLSHAIHVELQLPAILESADSIDSWRSRYRAGLAALRTRPGSLGDAGLNLVNTSSFYLAYHDRDDRPIMEELRDLFRARVPALTFTSPHLADWRVPSTSERRIRVGFLSEFLTEHTIGKLYRGFIRHLDRRRFEVIVIHAPRSKHDDLRRQIDADADRAFSLPSGLAAQHRAVADENLDVLFYPDIGMNRSTYFLAFARLAPVQAVAWGHPDTTGLDTVDYFVSAASIEPDGADALYSERLVCLNRLPCCFEPLVAPAELPGRAALGLPETGTLYGCPQSLFKFHPDFDPVLAAIAAGDPGGRIVLLEGSNPAWSGQLKKRWAARYPILADRVMFLPRMPMGRFMTLMAEMDVLLDPPHFGSGNTLYEALVYGIPVVTWPGRFMRARIVAGAYRQMAVSDAPVADDLEGYAPLTLTLGRDPERRREMRRRFHAAANRALFSDLGAVREFEAFLTAAVEAAGRGEKLAAGWRPAESAVQ